MGQPLFILFNYYIGMKKAQLINFYYLKMKLFVYSIRKHKLSLITSWLNEERRVKNANS
jgi:hypothetical protein